MKEFAMMVLIVLVQNLKSKPAIAHELTVRKFVQKQHREWDGKSITGLECVPHVE